MKVIGRATVTRIRGKLHEEQRRHKSDKEKPPTAVTNRDGVDADGSHANFEANCYASAGRDTSYQTE
jgi:hypothetical protein